MAGIYRPEVVRIHAIVAQPPDLEILDHDVGPARKLTDLSLSLRRGHVDRDGALAAIASMEIGRAEIGAVRCRHEGRPPASRIVANARSLDLEDVGAKIREKDRKSTRLNSSH